MRPKLQFLEKELIEKIVSEARVILKKLGVTIHNEKALALLADHGADVDLKTEKVHFNDDLIDKALKATPRSFQLYDINGEPSCDFEDDKIHFTPGSSSLYYLEHGEKYPRKVRSEDYQSYCKIVSQLPYIHAQSTAMVCSDIPGEISDSYRLYLSLLLCEKPVVTGAFTIEGFDLMKELQIIARGSEDSLKGKPLSIFSCCPTSPLAWSDVTSQNLIDCARYSIPVELIAMPMAGFIAPVTIVGTLVQHTAENLSGLVIHQLVNPGAPILWGGSPGIFDIRYETTPMGAVETMMIDCAYSEIGKYIGLPTQAYIGLSDAKSLDAQAGLETSMGATLAALSGINSISGPGMHDFENCFSLEKLIVDNEIAGMVLRMARGIEPREDFPALPHFEELLKEKHLLIADHTRKYLRNEHHFPGETIVRANQDRWQEEGSKTVVEIAHTKVEELLATYEPSSLSDDKKKAMTEIMTEHAKKYGMSSLPL